MNEKNISRREALQRLGWGLCELTLLSVWPSSCSPRPKHPDQKILCNRCDGCGQCHCPYGVDIAANLTLYNKEALAGRLPDPREGGTENYRRESADFIGRLNRIPRLAQADRCVNCGKCQGCCPQKVDIPRTLRQMESLIQKVKDDGTLA